MAKPEASKDGTIDVVLGEQSSSILIENGAFHRAGPLLAPFAREGRLVVITDRNVFAAQGARFAASLEQAGIAADGILIEPGEGSKDWSHLARLVDDLSARGVGRGDHVVALGGGVIGDLAGFAASIHKRGCGIIQIPTSLLAMVDSSVGGKTGINTPAGKNMVGSFHQPSFVLIDPSCLATLAERELRSGYAEVVKYGLIDDPIFFAWCEAEGAGVLSGDPLCRLHAIRTSVAIKARIVAEDPLETTGRRALLNLGHTFGHAIEAESGYQVAHGEAVAIGLTLAFRFAALRGICTVDDALRVEAHLTGVGLPTRIDAATDADGEQLVRRMLDDKKAQGGLVLITPCEIGEVFVEGGVDEEDLIDFLNAYRA